MQNILNYNFLKMKKIRQNVGFFLFYYSYAIFLNYKILNAKIIRQNVEFFLFNYPNEKRFQV